jgi:hypothetical protein
MCDPCPSAASCNRVCPAKEWRQHLVAVTAHEVGHALGLDHNPTDHGALMNGSLLNFWFHCGTAAPKVDDWEGLFNIEVYDIFNKTGSDYPQYPGGG